MPAKKANDEKATAKPEEKEPVKKSPERPHNEPHPVAGVLRGYLCPFCGSGNLETVQNKESVPVVHFKCRACGRPFATQRRKLK